MHGDYRRYLVRRGYAPATITGRMMVMHRWKQHLGHGRWRTATHHDVEVWIDELAVSPAVQRNYTSMLRGFYRWAMREGLCEHDPTALVDRPRLPRRLPRPAPEHEIARVLASTTPDVAAMVALMAAGGLRCCEVARLQWGDVRLDSGAVHVTGKGSRDRVVILPAQVVWMLTLLDTHTGAVFVNRFNAPYSSNRISRLVRLAFARHDYTTTAHQLRHRAASAALAVNGDLLAVRDFLGHSSVATTQGYTKVAGGAAAATSTAIKLPSVC